MTPPLQLYRDDGPIARAVGSLVRVSHSHSLVIVVALAPMFVLIALKGDGASHVAVGAALAWLVVVGGAMSGRAPADAFRWVVAPLLRLAEYAGLLWIGAVAGESSQPAAFAVLAVVAFHHYDLVYRLRNLGTEPPRRLGDLALGWDGRLVLGYILLVAGALPAGFFIAAGLLATGFVAESVAAWRRFGRAGLAVTYEDEEDIGH
jgi:Family of unknown function (DUF5941)